MANNKTLLALIKRQPIRSLGCMMTTWPFGRAFIVFFLFLPWQPPFVHHLLPLLHLHPDLLISEPFPGRPWSSADPPLSPEVEDSLEENTHAQTWVTVTILYSASHPETHLEEVTWRHRQVRQADRSSSFVCSDGILVLLYRKEYDSILHLLGRFHHLTSSHYCCIYWYYYFVNQKKKPICKHKTFPFHLI